MSYDILQSHGLKCELTNSIQLWLHKALQVVALPSRYVTLVLDFEKVWSWKGMVRSLHGKTKRLSISPIWHNLLVLIKHKVYAIALLHTANFFLGVIGFWVLIFHFHKQLPPRTLWRVTLSSQPSSHLTSKLLGLAYRQRKDGPAALPTTAEGPPQEST